LQLFCRKAFCSAFYGFSFCVYYFLAKEKWQKAACKMLVKLIIEANLQDPLDQMTYAAGSLYLNKICRSVS